MTKTPAPTPANLTTDASHRTMILNRLTKQTFCTLATSSKAGFPHVAGVVYEAVDSGAAAPDLWVHTTRSSRKARSIAARGRVAICVPFRRLPVGPPFTIHFQADAELVAMDDAKAQQVMDLGHLGSITAHGELDLPDGCFVRITPRGTLHSFGPGARILDLIRDPIGTGGRSFHLESE